MAKSLPDSARDTGSLSEAGRLHMLGGNSARVPQLPKPVRPLPVLSKARSHCKEEPVQSNEDLAQPEIS